MKNIAIDSPWPLLDAMMTQQRLGYIDKAIAEHLLETMSTENEASAVFLCHLSLAAQQGHLCISIDGNTLKPDPASIWVSKLRGDVAIDPLQFSSLSSMILKGANDLSKHLLASKQKLAPVQREGNYFYFQRNWILESNLIKNYLRVLEMQIPTLSVDQKNVRELIRYWKGKIIEEQASAVIHGCCHCLTIVIGGPGTGKTYTAGLLLNAIWQNLKEQDQNTCKVVVTAPTGKAASHLESSLLKTIEDHSKKPSIKSLTLHALLKKKRDFSITIDGDIIIVDECSMIDVSIMGELLSAVKPGARLILLGDTSQLPSVESGSVFHDIVSHQKSLPTNAVIELKVCQRAELQNIVDLATSINAGDDDSVMEQIQWNGGQGIAGRDLGNYRTPLHIQQAIVKDVIDKYPVYTDLSYDPEIMMKEFSTFRLLSPLREGYLGVDELNKKIYQACCKKSTANTIVVVPIMVTKNDYQLNVFNGDMGILVQPLGKVFLQDRKEGKAFKTMHESSLPSYEFAYCLSIHKSQGSEFDHVAVVLPEGSDVFGKEALYTAVTRARKSLEIWTFPETLKKMIHKCSKRLSGILVRL